MHRALLALLWFTATALATAVSSVGVSAVTAAVSDTPAPAIPATRVRELAAPSATSPSTTVAAAVTTTSTAPTTEPPRSSATTTVTTRVARPEAPTPAPTAASTVPSRTVTYSTRGGSVAVACEGSSISLVSASPADGYRVEVHDSGPEHVAVTFDAEGREDSSVAARCVDGQPVRDSAPPPAATQDGEPESGDH